MATPAQVDVRAGLDAGKGGHFADVLDDDGERLFAGAVANGQVAVEALLDRAARPLICLARRRCDVIVAMLRTGQPGQPNRPAPSLPEAA